MSKERFKLGPVSMVAGISNNVKSTYWIDKTPTHVKELFPNWLTASVILNDFCERTGGWLVEDFPDKRCINVSLDYPRVKDLVSGNMIPMINTFPPEEGYKVERICHQLNHDYTPDLQSFVSNRIDSNTLKSIRVAIQRREDQIINRGGLPILQELKIRFGIFPFSNLKIEVKV